MDDNCASAIGACSGIRWALFDVQKRLKAKFWDVQAGFLWMVKYT